jgi:hypothetical protein
VVLANVRSRGDRTLVVSQIVEISRIVLQRAVADVDDIAGSFLDDDPLLGEGGGRDKEHNSGENKNNGPHFRPPSVLIQFFLQIKLLSVETAAQKHLGYQYRRSKIVEIKKHDNVPSHLSRLSSQAPTQSLLTYSQNNKTEKRFA